MPVKVSRILVFSVLGLVILFGGVFLFSPRVNYQNPDRLRPLGVESFDVEKWRAADPEGRGALIHDFIRRGLHLGKTEGEIKALLGEPTARYLDPRHLAYQVGPAGPKSRFGDRFTFVLVRNKQTDRFEAFWIEPFPEEFFAKGTSP
jgi:hypothetical protein